MDSFCVASTSAFPDLCGSSSSNGPMVLLLRALLPPPHNPWDTAQILHVPCHMVNANL